MPWDLVDARNNVLHTTRSLYLQCNVDGAWSLRLRVTRSLAPAWPRCLAVEDCAVSFSERPAWEGHGACSCFFAALRLPWCILLSNPALQGLAAAGAWVSGVDLAWASLLLQHFLPHGFLVWRSEGILTTAEFFAF